MEPEIAFSILGIEPTNEFSKIKKAYTKTSLKYHPDKCAPGYTLKTRTAEIEELFNECDTLFKIINNAFNFLEENQRFLSEIVEHVKRIPKRTVHESTIRFIKTYFPKGYIFKTHLIPATYTSPKPSSKSPPKPTSPKPGRATGKKEEAERREAEMRAKAEEEEEKARFEAIRRSRAEAEAAKMARRREAEIRAKAEEEVEKARLEAIRRSKAEAEAAKMARKHKSPPKKSRSRSPLKSEGRYTSLLREYRVKTEKLQRLIPNFYDRISPDFSFSSSLIEEINSEFVQLEDLRSSLMNFHEYGLTALSEIVKEAESYVSENHPIAEKEVNLANLNFEKVRILVELFNSYDHQIESIIERFYRMKESDKMLNNRRILSSINEKFSQFRHSLTSRYFYKGESIKIDDVPLIDFFLETLQHKIVDFTESHRFAKS